MSGKPNDKVFKTMVKKHGSEEAARAWYRKLGAKGGRVRSPIKGFGSNRELARIAGAKGGAISRRNGKKVLQKA